MKKDSFGKIILFGEAEKGDFHLPFQFSSLIHLADSLGNPPDGSMGLHLGIQTLLFEKELIFIRVREEGFSIKDYMLGLSLLKEKEMHKDLLALGLPGVGDAEILAEAFHFCHSVGAFLMTTEKDFYDYLTHSRVN